MNLLSEDLQKFKNKQTGPVLIVGASGFIGSSYYKAFKEKGISVFGTTTSHRNWRALCLNEEFLELDVTCIQQVKEIILKIRPKLIINCASYGNFHWHENPSRNFEVNIKGLINLLEVSRMLADVTFIHMGSSSEYGENVANANEQSEPLPNSLYGVMKQSSGQLIEYYHRVHHVHAIHLRLFSIYGAMESPDRLIPKLVAAKETGKLPLIVQNETSRDFVYIDDLIHCTLKILFLSKSKSGGQIINICSSKSYSILEAAQVAKSLWNIQDNIEFSEEPQRTWDVKHWQGDNTKLIELVGQHTFKNLEDGLKLMAEEFISIKDSKVEVERKDKIISVVVAAFNDQTSLEELYSQLRLAFLKTDYDFELIIVDDNSPDQTKTLIQNLSAKDSRILGIHHTRSFGSQAGFLSGLRHSKGQAVVFMDGDLQDPPKHIPEMIKKWEEGAKIVGAKRASRTEANWLTLCRRIFYRLLASFSMSPVHIDVGDFALIDHIVAEKIKQYAHGVFFLRTLRAYFGYEYSEIAYHRPERFHGKSTNNLLKNIWWALFGFFSVANKLTFLAAMMLILAMFLTVVSSTSYLFVQISILFALFVLVNQVFLFMFNFNKFPPYLVKEYTFHGKTHPHE